MDEKAGAFDLTDELMQFLDGCGESNLGYWTDRLARNGAIDCRTCKTHGVCESIIITWTFHHVTIMEGLCTWLSGQA